MIGPSIALIERAAGFGPRVAVVSPRGEFTYAQLLEASARVAAGLLQGRADLAQERVAFLAPRGFTWTALLWGIWRAGGVAVPLSELHPAAELAYALADSQAGLAAAHPEYADRLRPLAQAAGSRFFTSDELLAAPPGPLPALDPGRRAMILYTSGTTGAPKGVVHTHANLEAQVEMLVQAWQWSPEDYILHVLPLHHVHGIVNVLLCALFAGARCEFLPRFEAELVWQKFAERPLTLFMAVPTIYAKLIAAWEAAPAPEQARLSAACAKLRLMVSGSAALPVSVLEKWQAISGHRLLERYGMTEIGMALSNPVQGERRPGFVGAALPGVELRLLDEAGREAPSGEPGEILVRGPAVFGEYWQRPAETRDAFRDGWFLTGDVAVVEDGAWRILGRKSADIIKTGGYKVSALEIEEVLRTHPAVAECAVVGLEDPEWGERVAAALILRPSQNLTLEELRAWGKERLAPYKVPSLALFVEELPRNAMGKVTKPAVKRLFQTQQI
ncbi:MAG: long-chain fatty acid--CoA ligase [Desulfarculus sp.]|nr:MAG: long-chain fatty acid--CoA ligase [Desulfarculus sp.]